MRRLVYALSLVIVVWAAFSVPMPFIEIAPGGAPDIAPLVEIADEQTTTPLSGSLHLLTVSLDSPSFADLVRTRLDEHRELTNIDNVIPAGVDPELYFEQQRRQFQLSFDVAAAVGVREAGFDVDVRTATTVFDVLPGAPADGVLQPDDVIVEFDGIEVTSGDQLRDTTGSYEMGVTVPVVVRRDDGLLDLTVTIGQSEGMPRPGLGIRVLDDIDVGLPFAVNLGETRIGGPSAGMMIALTVYDLLADEDLTRGRVITGTGTIRLDGTVGSISGIASKVAAAEAIGADVMLVPRSLEDPAREALTTSMQVIGVRTFTEALEALRG